MMRYSLTLAIGLFSFCLIAQSDGSSNGLLTFSMVEHVPVAPGCEAMPNPTNSNLKGCFQRYVYGHISKEFKYPEQARREGVEALIFITFVVEPDGSLTNFQVVRSASRKYRRRSREKREAAQALDKEALRVAKALQVALPATQDGKPVRMSFTLPINAKL